MVGVLSCGCCGENRAIRQPGEIRRLAATFCERHAHGGLVQVSVQFGTEVASLDAPEQAREWLRSLPDSVAS